MSPRGTRSGLLLALGTLVTLLVLPVILSLVHLPVAINGLLSGALVGAFLLAFLLQPVATDVEAPLGEGAHRSR